MDDGWFGQRNDDHAGLGDWSVNPQKFPNGLKGLIGYVNGLGMKFGLWVEPEMVNPNSDLYRAHPDWAMHFNDRPRSEARNQLVLNMARDDVRDHIFAVLDKLVSENHIEFLKWDMNRHFGEPGWPEAPVAEQKQIWVKYVDNVYNIIDRLRAKHPGLEIESCSGGGGRVDLGILKRVDEVWTSDNTEAFDRLRIQEGFTYAYAPKVMMAWVTDVPNLNGRSTPLQYRFLVAMQGSLGIGSNLNHWTDADFALASRMVAIDKEIRATVQQGNLYRLFSPREGRVHRQPIRRAGWQAGRAVRLSALAAVSAAARPSSICAGWTSAPCTGSSPSTTNWWTSSKPPAASYLMNHGMRASAGRRFRQHPVDPGTRAVTYTVKCGGPDMRMRRKILIGFCGGAHDVAGRLRRHPRTHRPRSTGWWRPTSRFPTGKAPMRGCCARPSRSA